MAWTISQDVPAKFKITWQKSGGPAPKSKSKPGFGKLVLEKLMPAAVEGTAEIIGEADGIEWTLSAPLDRVLRN